MATILIIDDDQELSTMLAMKVQRLGHEAETASTLQGGIRKATSGGYDVVFLDVRMPDGNGLERIPEIRATVPAAPEVIIMTGVGERSGAALAIKNGAWDYIEKTFLARDFELPLARALQYRKEKGTKVPVSLQREEIIGESHQLRGCLDLVAQATASLANVLITGATGTGKELFASAIHQNSARARKSFVVVDCAALPDSLVESMLFGHAKGAFTGADQDHDGLIRQADGGTLFLDEVGELPLSLQKAFLRALQEHRFRPLGSRHEVNSDFRLIAATNRDLSAMVKEGSFRQDLLYRLNSLYIKLPTLHQRLEDIRPLALSFITRFCQQYQIPAKGISSDFFDALEAYDWPGNVRELKNTIEQVLAISGDDANLYVNHLPVNIRIQLTTSQLSSERLGQPSGLALPSLTGDGLPTLKEFRRKAYQTYAQSLRDQYGHDIKEACRVSGLSRSRLYAFFQDHNKT
jgi:two-component system, NtrC family, response regulator